MFFFIYSVSLFSDYYLMASVRHASLTNIPVETKIRIIKQLDLESRVNLALADPSYDEILLSERFSREIWEYDSVVRYSYRVLNNLKHAIEYDLYRCILNAQTKIYRIPRGVQANFEGVMRIDRETNDHKPFLSKLAQFFELICHVNNIRVTRANRLIFDQVILANPVGKFLMFVSTRYHIYDYYISDILQYGRDGPITIRYIENYFRSLKYHTRHHLKHKSLCGCHNHYVHCRSYQRLAGITGRRREIWQYFAYH